MMKHDSGHTSVTLNKQLLQGCTMNMPKITTRISKLDLMQGPSKVTGNENSGWIGSIQRLKICSFP